MFKIIREVVVADRRITYTAKAPTMQGAIELLKAVMQAAPEPPAPGIVAPAVTK